MSKERTPLPLRTLSTTNLLAVQQVERTACPESGRTYDWMNTVYEYDAWGNPTRVTNARGYATTTVYDDVHHVYPVSNTTPPLQNGNLFLTTSYDWDVV
ncbi:MAG: hypothetical protein H0T73_12675, partial [Ardenticatenales bacterium]|nr:hypothetical protein [Ardenticatenales bacterium]